MSIKEPPYRPIPPKDSEEYPAGMMKLMNDCWEETPSHRPAFTDIKKRLRRINKGRCVENHWKCLSKAVDGDSVIVTLSILQDALQCNTSPHYCYGGWYCDMMLMIKCNIKDEVLHLTLHNECMLLFTRYFLLLNCLLI